MIQRALTYGKKKDFVYDHYADIKQLRRRHSAREVAAIYGGIINEWDIYNVEKLNKITKKDTK